MARHKPADIMPYLVQAHHWLAERGMTMTTRDIRTALHAVDSPVTSHETILTILRPTGLNTWLLVCKEVRRLAKAEPLATEHSRPPPNEEAQAVRNVIANLLESSGNFPRLVTEEAAGQDVAKLAQTNHEHASLSWTGKKSREEFLSQTLGTWRDSEERNEATRKRVEQARIVRWDFGDRPIMLVGIGDAHIGSKACDYARLRRVADIVYKTQGAFAFQIGDLIDNMLWKADEHSSSKNTMPEQIALAAVWLAMMGPKMLGVVSGNHEAWMNKWAHLDVIRDIIKPTMPGLESIPYSSDFMFLETVVGGKSWLHELRHIVQGNSMYSPAHGAKRHLRYSSQMDVDAIWVGHTHRSEYQETKVLGRMRHLLQLGAYKVSTIDGFAAMYGFSDENMRAEMCMIIEPGAANVKVIPDIEVAHQYFTRVVRPQNVTESLAFGALR